MFLCFLEVVIIVPNKTNNEPNKKSIVIISPKNVIPHSDPNKTCR